MYDCLACIIAEILSYARLLFAFDSTLDFSSVTGEAEFPGDFRNGFIDFGWDIFDDRVKLVKRGIELNNGRAAMMGILGLMVHEKINELSYYNEPIQVDLPFIGVL